MSTWSPVRRRFAALALAAALVTVVLWLAMGGSGGRVTGGMYLALAGAALFLPAGITVQILAGQVLVVDLLLGQAGLPPLLLTPVVMCVVVTAELLAVVARLDSPLRCEPGDALARAGVSAGVAGGVFGAVALVSGLPGPGGPVAVVLASVACAIMAARLIPRAG